jgi:4-hydroxy-3-polyprenylbenzoate decarboxylase
MSRSLRDHLTELSGSGDLVTIGETVDPAHELAALLHLLEAGPAVRLDDVAGSRMPVVGNVVNSRERIARALGLQSVADISAALLDAVARPVPTTPAPAGEPAPAQQVVEPANLGALPVPTFFEKETGAYITAGVILVQDVVSGERNLSFARFKVLDERRAMLGVSPNHHLGRMAQRAAEADVDLPIAVAIGTHPAVMLAACLYLGFGDDELECAGRLLGEPVEVVKAVTSGILVPADSELVLEGVVKPLELLEEGLVSEFHGRYHDYGPGYLVEFSTMTHRVDPLFQVIVPGLHQEHLLLGAVSIAAGLSAHLKRVAPNVVEVAVPDTGAGRTSAVVSVRGVKPGQAKQLIMAAMSAVSLIKQVVVVDAEVDPWNTEAVEWARLFHARPERDFLVVPGARTDRSDPLVQGFTIGKLGVDATAKPGERAEGWAFAHTPADAAERAGAVLRRAGLQPQQSPLVAGIQYD